MKSKLKATAGLAGAFVAGMVMATALFSWAAAGSKMPGERDPGHQVTVPDVISPTITDEDIALLRQDLRAKKMQVIGQNMSLSDGEAQKFWPIYNHYVKDLQEVNNQKYALLKQYAHMWGTMTDQDAVIYVRNWLEVDQQVQALRVKYVPAVNQVLPRLTLALVSDDGQRGSSARFVLIVEVRTGTLALGRPALPHDGTIPSRATCGALLMANK